MKKLVALLLLSLTASFAFAGLDDGTDSFGVYFDVNGETSNFTTPVFAPFNVYLLLMNPAGITDGYECTVTPTGAPYFTLATTLPLNALDVDASANGFAVGAAAPLPVNAGGAMVLCTWQYMVQAATPLEFRISQATQPSMPGGLPVVTGEGILRRCGISSGSVTAPVAYVNSPNLPIATEISSFGAVKGLFR